MRVGLWFFEYRNPRSPRAFLFHLGELKSPPNADWDYGMYTLETC